MDIKKFPNSFEKFYHIPAQSSVSKQEMKRQAANIGMRLPEKM
jgi:hypothetical protein